MPKPTPLQILLSVTAMILWLSGVYAAQQAAEGAMSILVRFPGGGVSPAELSRQEAYFKQDGMRNMPDAVIWLDHAGQTVETASGGTSGVTATEVYGGMSLARQSRIVAGAWPQAGDAEGCVVSDTTAFALWNGVNVVGMPLHWNGRTYYVRGVVRDDGRILLIQAPTDSAVPFDNMRLSFPEGGGREEAQTYLTRAGFTGAEILDLPLLAWALELLAYLPALLLAASALFKLLRQVTRLIPRPRQLAVYLPFAVVAGAGCVWVASYAPAIPARIVPGKWSDFEFFSELASDTVSRVSQWLSASSDLALWGRALAAAALLLASLILFAAVTGRVRVTTPGQWAAAAFGSLALTFVMTLAFSGYGLTISDGVRLAPVLWVTLDFGLNWLNERIKSRDPAKTADLAIAEEQSPESNGN